MMWLSYPDPHPPFAAPAPWCDQYDPDAVDLPNHWVLDLENRPWWHRDFLAHRAKKKAARDNQFGNLDSAGSGAFTERELRHITAMYYAMIAELDSHLGRVLKCLDDLGQFEDTYIIFISDHGEWLGDHGLLLKGPMLYDGLLRVPCVMCGPQIEPDQIVATPVSTVDIKATLADYCGLDAAPDHGASWRKLLDAKETRDYALNEWEVDPDRSGISLDLRTVRTETHRLSIDLNTGTGEAYDLANDPDEMHNLFDDSGYQAKVKELVDMVHDRPKDEIAPSARVGWH